MFFHYTVLNPDQKKLSGVVEAKSLADAEEKLNELGYSIIELKPTEGSLPKTAGMARFSFEALDKKERKVKGTIESASFEEALERLNEEYELRVKSLYPHLASEDEKKQADEKLKTLQTAEGMEKSIEEKTDKKKKDKERQELMKLMDHTVETVRNFLTKYEPDMKKEEQDAIKSYLNQLARIKDSTNLEHIRKTSEKMLQHIREKELFLKEKKKEQEEMQIKVEAKTLLFDIHHTGLRAEIDILSLAERMALSPSPWNYALEPIGKFILRFYGADDPEIRAQYLALRKIRKKIIEFAKLRFFSKNSNIRSEAGHEIQRLLAERKRLKFQLTAVKTKRKEALSRIDMTVAPSFSNTFLFFGWLFSFYLLFYFFSYPFTFFETGLKNPPSGFNFYKSPVLESILIFLFLFHVTSGLKKMFLPKHFLSDLLLVPISTVLYLFFLFNFIV